MEANRKGHSFLAPILKYDVILTKKLVDFLLKFSVFKSIRIHGTFLDLSCNGIVWFPLWIALIWLLNNKNLYEMQVNMLMGLAIDIVLIALLKAFTRRRRPAPDKGAFIGPDKFSFPSGHSSRAFLVLFFFTNLWSLPKIFWLPLFAWASCVALSRLLLRRHYILDICAGILLAILECGVLNLLWIGSDKALSLVEYVATDYLADGGLEE